MSAALPNMTIELNAKFLETLSTPVVVVDAMGKKICGNTAGEKLLDTLFFNIDKIQTSPKNTTPPQDSSHHVNLPELMQSICPVYLDQGDYLLKITALSPQQSILEWISRSENKRLELLQDVSRAVNSSLIMEDIFESLGEVLRHYIQYDEASIVILDESQNTIKTLVRMQPDGFVDINPESHAFAGYDSIVNLLVTNPVPQTIHPPQLYDSLVFSKEVLGENAHGLLIPLINKGVVIGLIALLHTNPISDSELPKAELNPLSSDVIHENTQDVSSLSLSAIKNPDFEKNLLIQISEHLAIAVENAKFYWQTQSQASREFLINQITKSIRQSLDMDKILQTAAMELGKVTGVSRCYITYFSTGFIVPHTFSMLSGPKESSSEGMSLELDRVPPEALLFDNSFLEVEKSPKIKLYQYIMHGVSTLIMNQQNLEHRIFYLRHQSFKNAASQETDNEFNPFVLNDTRDCSGVICPQDFFKMNEIKSLAIFPILVEERLVGTITLHQCDTFRSWIAEDIQLLQAIAEHLGVALRQSRLFAELENQKTALESALVELQQTQVHLVQSEKMAILGQFVAGIAHEVNTPLGTISSNNNTLKSCVNKLTQETSELELTPKAQSIFGMMHNLIDLNNMGTERIHEIVKNLRNFARLDESALKVVDIHEGIDSTLLVMQSSLSSYIKVVKNYSQTLPQVQCYPGLLNQVFMNLLVNATHAMAEMPEGTITIETHFDEETEMIHVCFQDTGTGIAPEHLSKLFDPTFTTKRRGLGTGLGLALSFRIVEKHRGKIIVDTEMGVGTKFSVVIPVKQNNNT